MVDDGPGAVTDELYTVDPGDFVAARTALVRRLRAEKRRELAAEVAALRRPSPAAWAVNQLVRGQRADVEALLALGEALRLAQDRAMSGADAAGLRASARARRDAVAALTGAAARLLATRGGGVDAHLAGVTATLEAASLDPDLGAGVLEGRLSAELEPPSGFGDLAVGFVDPPVRKPPPPSPAPTAPDPLEMAAHAMDEARRQSEELAAAARTARGREERHRRAVEEAQGEVTRLRGRLEAAEHASAAALAEADAVGDRALAADRAADEAVERLHEAEQRWRDAAG